MSHEGIRIVSGEAALHERKHERLLTREAIEPRKVRVDKTGGSGLEIDWKDGHSSKWTFAWLRHGCPCATCVDEREGLGLDPGQAKPEQRAANSLPMFKEPPRPRDVKQVGNYAIRFTWNDGHESGIYSWDYLRRVCLCAECVEAR